MYSEPTTPAVRPALYRRSLPVVLLIALSFVLCLTGCSNGESTASASLVRTINAYIPAPGADGSLTFIGNSIFLTGGNLAFGQVANGGGYITITSGPLSASASGPAVTTAITLTGQTLNGNGTAYTLLGAGEAGQTGTLAPQLILIPNYTANQITLPSGDAAVRVVNLSLNPNPVGLFSTNSGAPTTAVATGLGSVAYGYSSVNNAYVAVPTTQLANMALVDANTHAALSLSSTSDLNTFTFVAGQAYTLYVIGQPGNNNEPLGVLWVVDFPTS